MICDGFESIILRIGILKSVSWIFVKTPPYRSIAYMTRDPTELLALLGSDYNSVVARSVKARKFGPGNGCLFHSKLFAHAGRDICLRPECLEGPDGPEFYYALWMGSSPVTGRRVKAYVTSDEAVFRGHYMHTKDWEQRYVC